MKKKVTFLFCTGPLFSFFSPPISRLSEANLKKGLGLIETNASDVFYVSIDGFEARERKSAEEFILGKIRVLDQKLASKIQISALSKNFENSFVLFLLGLGVEEVLVDVLGGVSQRIGLKARIDEAIMRHPGADFPYKKIPRVYMS